MKQSEPGRRGSGHPCRDPSLPGKLQDFIGEDRLRERQICAVIDELAPADASTPQVIPRQRTGRCGCGSPGHVRRQPMAEMAILLPISARLTRRDLRTLSQSVRTRRRLSPVSESPDAE